MAAQHNGGKAKAGFNQDYYPIDKVCTCACVLALHHNREAHPYNTRAHVFQTSIKRSTDAPFSRIGRP